MRGRRRIPLPKGSWFITAWKYWGIANSSPNMANVTRVASTVPQVKRAERNRPRSTSGIRLPLVTRRSQTTKAKRADAPITRPATAHVLDQPCSPAWITP